MSNMSRAGISALLAARAGGCVLLGLTGIVLGTSLIGLNTQAATGWFLATTGLVLISVGPVLLRAAAWKSMPNWLRVTSWGGWTMVGVVGGASGLLAEAMLGNFKLAVVSLVLALGMSFLFIREHRSSI